jgi:hypothetical protein
VLVGPGSRILTLSSKRNQRTKSLNCSTPVSAQLNICAPINSLSSKGRSQEGAVCRQSKLKMRAHTD